MKLNRKLMAVVALALVVFSAGIVLAQVTPLSTDTYGRFLGNGPAPVLSACGTLPVIATTSTDTSGTITIGTGTPAACTMTFARAWSAAPTCYFNDRTTANVTNGTSVIYKVAESTTAVTVTFAIATVNGDSIGYMCLGR